VVGMINAQSSTVAFDPRRTSHTAAKSRDTEVQPITVHTCKYYNRNDNVLLLYRPLDGCLVS